MSFGYIGTAGKTQTQISNSGVFSLDEVQAFLCTIIRNHLVAGMGCYVNLKITNPGALSSCCS